MNDEGNNTSQDFELNRDLFLRQMVRELAGTLEEVVGLEEANGFLALTGQRIADNVLKPIRNRLGDHPTTTTLGDALSDFKSRIQGDFYVIETSEDRLVLGNRTCPFGVHVQGRASLCMMTSNVFGIIASDSFGYARVDLEQTIARGDKECRVAISLQPDHATPSSESIREYFR